MYTGLIATSQANGASSQAFLLLARTHCFEPGTWLEALYLNAPEEGGQSVPGRKFIGHPTVICCRSLVKYQEGG